VHVQMYLKILPIFLMLSISIAMMIFFIIIAYESLKAILQGKKNVDFMYLLNNDSYVLLCLVILTLFISLPLSFFIIKKKIEKE